MDTGVVLAAISRLGSCFSKWIGAVELVVGDEQDFDMRGSTLGPRTGDGDLSDMDRIESELSCLFKALTAISSLENGLLFATIRFFPDSGELSRSLDGCIERAANGDT